MTTALTIDALKARAEALANEIKAVEPSLTLIFALHHHGQLQNTLHMMEDLIVEHPAGRILHTITNRAHPSFEPSCFQGLAASQTRSWFSFHAGISLLGLISINVDQYESLDLAMMDLFHYTWQGLEMVELCRKPDMLERLKSRPMTPKRGPISEAKSCLRSDIFSALMMATDGYPQAVADLARARALQVIQKTPLRKPQNYPFPIAREATEYALNEILPALDQNRPRLTLCKDITYEIANSTGEEQIQHWWHFCEPAQDMAWRGFKAADILGTSLYTSEDPFVRAIAHQIISATDITPTPLYQIKNTYNPFTTLNNTASTHEALVQETFDMVLSEGLSHDSSRPLISAANDQNRNLLQGRFLGWCANALQAAATAFDQALSSGKPIAQAAKLEFEIHRDGPPVENLNQLTKDIILRQRNGQIVTLDMIPELTKGMPDMDRVTNSIKQTLVDPQYRRTLDAAQKLTRTIEPEQAVSHLGLHLNLAPAPEAEPQAVPSPITPGVMPVLDFSPGASGFLTPRPITMTPHHLAQTPPPSNAAPSSDLPPLELELVENEDPDKS